MLHVYDSPKEMEKKAHKNIKITLPFKDIKILKKWVAYLVTHFS